MATRPLYRGTGTLIHAFFDLALGSCAPAVAAPFRKASVSAIHSVPFPSLRILAHGGSPGRPGLFSMRRQSSSLKRSA